MIAQTHRDRALEVARRQGIARGSDFDAAGVPRVYLQRLRDEGVLQQVGRGLYKLANAEVASATSLAEAARIKPKGVIGLLSALQFHNLTTQTPHAVWMLLGPKDWAPSNPSVTLKIVRASGEALTAGIEIHQVDGVPVPITSPAKTVADCFKHRNKIGLDVAIEALRDLIKSRKGRAGLNELWRYAEIDRVQTVMRPYIEAMVS
ncbi:type IV toxin-antitoxin system AbiEi family antitoxin domain-containing protein [Phyllobacterium chamaecytisi]|jgi:predicted transcriptional regulator of viral defense system|uniref:type IV toxin-antitoxin system AbiEi family antitoxin domain-containing protein n=1 Tax=Phyllobacterium chamaecytisi TaxID=2876082 RepID=UPI001CCB7E3A|nr:type IV toxin-antitoxin system AbiEi family antitoxin domain-containing protein [Phyllobacterium sp. KW56]MBZ9605820.1 type IV toxin-antitoxin system AbiEi family antitoxin domain-containing protein [Phyllobacterium sp. KW56]